MSMSTESTSDQLDEPPPARPYPPALGVAITVLYLLLSLGWMVGTGLVLAVVMLVGAASSGDFGQVLAGGEPAMGAGLLGLATILQFVGMLGIAAALAAFTGRPMPEAFALRAPTVGAIAAGALGGLTVGVFPGKIAEQLMEQLPQLNLGNLEMINTILSEGPWSGRLVLAFGVVVLAPLVEELVFRGFLWDALSKALPMPLVWIGTSVLFAMYHVDPVHVAAVLFTGLFLGWLRWMGGSVWACVLAHGVNNALAASMAMIYGAELAEAHLPWWAAILAGLVTVGFGALALIRRAPQLPTEAALPESAPVGDVYEPPATG